MGKRLHSRKYQSAKQTQTDWDWAESIQNEVEEREKREKEAAKSLETSQASAYDDLETPLISFGIGSEISDLTSSGRESADFPYLPSVGPPKILQYKRESVSKDSFECESEDFSGESFSDICKSYGIFSGDCEFCRKVIKPVPTLEQQETLPSEELYCCEKYKEFLELVFRAKLKELEVEQEEESSRMDDEEQDESSIKKEFKRRKKMAKIREQITKESKKQEDYQAEPQKPLINASLEESLTQGSGSLRSIAGTIHSKWSKNKIKKSQLGYAATSSFTGHQGEKTSETGKPGDKLEASQVSKSEKKDSKTEKKGVKLEIEESKMKTSKSEISVKKENLYKKEVLSSVGRQLNTINYQLSSEWCMALGWTLLKPTEIIEELDGDYFEAEPGTSLSLYSSMKPKANETLEKYYDNGQKFLTVFPDGTGNIFYPSGNVAIMITSLDSKHFTYIVQENVNIHPQILAFFSPTGDGCCYYSTGIVRLLIDPFGGIELDPDGARKKKWSWNDLEPHVHAPPLQPICVGINRFIGLRMVSQRNIHLSFMSRKYCCRFNIGTNIKLVTPGTLFKGVDDDKLFLREKIAHMESLLNKVTTLLRFPKSSRVERILPPLHLTNKLQRVELLRRQRDPTKIKKPITVMLHAK